MAGGGRRPPYTGRNLAPDAFRWRACRAKFGLACAVRLELREGQIARHAGALKRAGRTCAAPLGLGALQSAAGRLSQGLLDAGQRPRCSCCSWQRPAVRRPVAALQGSQLELCDTPDRSDARAGGGSVSTTDPCRRCRLSRAQMWPHRDSQLSLSQAHTHLPCYIAMLQWPSTILQELPHIWHQGRSQPLGSMLRMAGRRYVGGSWPPCIYPTLCHMAAL